MIVTFCHTTVTLTRTSASVMVDVCSVLLPMEGATAKVKGTLHFNKHNSSQLLHLSTLTQHHQHNNRLPLFLPTHARHGVHGFLRLRSTIHNTTTYYILNKSGLRVSNTISSKWGWNPTPSHVSQDLMLDQTTC